MSEADIKKPVGKIFPKKPAVSPSTQKSPGFTSGGANPAEAKRPRIRIELPIRPPGNPPVKPF
jgi:hypothetical protein